MSILGPLGQPISSPKLLPTESDSHYNRVLEPFRFKPGPQSVMGEFCNVRFDQMPKEDLIAVIGLREAHWQLEMQRTQHQHQIDLRAARAGR